MTPNGITALQHVKDGSFEAKTRFRVWYFPECERT